MKKVLPLILLFALCFSIMSFAASVPPTRHDGNDSNPNDYTPPPGCIHYEIPGSGNPGTYTVKFNNAGAVDPNGTNIFTVVVGTKPGDDFTSVLSWSSNFAVSAVIVKGGNAFNLYQYPNTTRSDSDLVSPNNASGHPADVSHVSVVICPPLSPTPTAIITPTTAPTITITPTPTGCPPCPGNTCITGILIVSIIVAFFILGFLLALIFCKCKHHHC